MRQVVFLDIAFGVNAVGEHLFEHGFAGASVDFAGFHHLNDHRKFFRRKRHIFRQCAGVIEQFHHFAHNPVCDIFGAVAKFYGLFKQRDKRHVPCENFGVIFGKPQRFAVALFFLLGQFRHAFADFLDARVGNFNRRQVGFGEIFIVLRVLFGAHRVRIAFVVVPAAGFLHDRFAVFQKVDLAAGFVCNRAGYRVERV